MFARRFMTIPRLELKPWLITWNYRLCKSFAFSARLCARRDDLSISIHAACN